MIVCPTCGNESDRTSRKCRFCQTELTAETGNGSSRSIVHKIINLEQGRPFVESALKRMENGLVQARAGNVKVLTLIHGYGSSGKGGAIRIECRKMLDHLIMNGEIKGMIPGENFNRRSGRGKDLIRRFPGLDRLCGSDFNNPGITIVEI